jgi:hypothetical protein
MSDLKYLFGRSGAIFRSDRKRFRLPAGVMLALMVGSNWNAAESVWANDPVPIKGAAETVAAVAAPSPQPAAIEGFRQARFGMSEEQVRAAVRSDFPAAAASLATAVNPSEKTTVLSLTVPDLMPRTGKAHISYIFGYRSKKLIQVNIIWVSDRSPGDDQTIVSTANALRDYFAAEAFPTANVVLNRQLAANAILVFRGSDDRKRTVLLVLNGEAASPRQEAKAGPPPPLTLELSYIADPAHPDVFRIGKGQF